jgi:hypothetical protein
MINLETRMGERMRAVPIPGCHEQRAVVEVRGGQGWISQGVGCNGQAEKALPV